MSPKAQPGTDPRSVVTPDAFRVDPELLGIPLARPGRRFWALLLDLLAVTLITAVTDNFWFILPFIIGFFFLSRGFKREGEQTSMVRLKRFSLGCLGMAVLGGSALVVVILQVADGDTLERAVGGLVAAEQFTELTDVQNPEAAFRLAMAIGRSPVGERMELDQLRSALEETMPSTVGGRDSDEIIEDVLAALAVERESGAPPPDDAPAEAAGDTLAEAPPTPRERALQARVSELEASVERQRARAEEAESGFWAWLRSRLDTLSFGVGWWTMYFAILMPWMKGATPGKKLMGIRVVRLDGQPVTWWHAFERAGGYAAGLATGLLGFAQILWDPNRQAIHDRVAGTVVVRAGAQRVPGQWEHLVESETVRIAREAGDPDVPDAPPPPDDPDPTPDDE